ncbi:type I restriction-modification system subunit M [Clostridium sporogenes]|uniref:site-specific DNA-methyltransferase (adenine-specific) n=1 Tax=Clostridium sporogenes TaxID=1509 RepID=A0AAE4FJ83_CLOSG|nr:type I restriction-modification system subunit M [Clostridium sporogenes]MDS1003254.1 type I restriction-modification system subunit M [Clostridium sporogenes]
MNKQQLASTIWESANQMRSKIEANEYKDFILGFIFYKYLSEKELNLMESEGFTEEQIKKVNESDTKYMEHIKNELGYFIAYDNLFSTWLAKGSDFDVSNVRDALSAFDRNIDSVYKKVYEKIFNTLQTGLSKLGESAQAQTKAIKGLLKLIKRIPMDGKQDYDVLGFIYEYLISMFAANAGKKAGEFYTPHEVSVLMSEIIADHLKDRDEIKIYDPTSGSGSLLINIGHSIAKYMDGDGKIEYYAQELKENTYNLTRMNLVMRGIKPANIFVRNGDTLEDDWPFFEDKNKENTYRFVSVDAVVSNPPYSQKWDITDKKFDQRYKHYGVAPKGKADYAFLLHDLYHLENYGIMTIVLPHGVLFRGSDEGKIRQNLIEKDKIDTIIGLPPNIFFGTSIPTIIMVLKKNRPNNDVLIIDASKGFEKDGKNNKLRACDIKKIADTVKARKSVDKYAALVSKETIVENEYNLNIPRYIDSTEEAEQWDIRSIMFGGIPKAEVEQLKEYWEAFPCVRDVIFKSISEKYMDVRCSDIKKTVTEHISADAYKTNFIKAFDGFYELLKKDLIDDILDVPAESEKEKICEEMFGRLESIPLTDRYYAYQILSDKWNIISADLEMIQTEGFDVINQVDPNMVIKKKDVNDDEVPEVQEGWNGHILPFDLVQKEILTEDLVELTALEDRLEEIGSLYADIIESMEEEEKESSVLNDSNDAFVSKEVKNTVVEILQDIENDEIFALKEYLKLSKKKEKLEYIENCSSVTWESMELGVDGTYKKGSVNNRIKEIQLGYQFDQDSFENKMITVLKLMEEESQAKKDVKLKAEELHLKTKETIEKLDEDTSLKLLELKWIEPLLNELYTIPDDVIEEMISKVVILADKYNTTFSDVEDKIDTTGKALSSMISELVGNEYDMEGLTEFRKILGV